MSFKNILRKQRQSGSGLASAAAGAAGASIREAIDIRNILFTKDSLLGALFPNVKGFKADGKTPRSKTSPSSIMSMGSSSSALSDEKLDIISKNTQISAKNSMTMPAMARDMNVMRQNMVKMVKLSGGKPSTRADMFFMRAAERESAYESRIQESKSTSPTNISSGEDDKKSGGGLIGSMLAALVATFLVFKGIMGIIATSAIFKLFTGGIAVLMKSIFAVIGSPLVLGIIAGFLPLLYTMFKTRDALNAPPDRDDLRDLQLRSNRNAINQGENVKIGGKTAAQLIEEEQVLYNRAAQNPRMLTESKEKESAARIKALESVGFFRLEVDNPETGKKQLLFRREIREDNIGGLDLPSNFTPAAPATGAAPASTTPTPISSNPSEGEKAVRAAASKYGITDATEINALLAQTGHESGNFRQLTELGSKSYFERYEGRADLGNTQPGDGYKYRGRGYIQLTGRANYEQFAKFSGLDVINNPDLVATPSVGAEAALWFWKTRVKPNVKDFSDVKSVTRIVNGGLNGLADREQRFASLTNQSTGSATTLASVGSSSGATLASASPRVSGAQIASASSAVESARMETMSPSTLLPAMTSMATPKTPGPQAQQVTIPNTIDSDLFDALIGRATEFS